MYREPIPPEDLRSSILPAHLHGKRAALFYLLKEQSRLPRSAQTVPEPRLFSQLRADKAAALAAGSMAAVAVPTRSGGGWHHIFHEDSFVFRHAPLQHG